MFYFVIYCSTFEAQEFNGEVKYIHFRFEVSTAVTATPCILVALYHNTLNHASSNITLRIFLCFKNVSRNLSLVLESGSLTP
jgi:hypothetical protein